MASLPTADELVGDLVSENQFKLSLIKLINNVVSIDTLATEKHEAINYVIDFSQKYTNSAVVKALNLSLKNYSNHLALAPVSLFDESSFSVVDNKGRELNNYKLLTNLNKTSAKTVLAPVDSYDDTGFSTVSKNGYVIDLINKTKEKTILWDKKLYIEYEALTKTLKVAWKHDQNLMFRSVWCPNGHNNLFNFKSLSKATLGDPSQAAWTVLQSETSDFLPPVTFLATDGEFSDSGTTTVGGNHGTNGGDGLLTAQMTEFKIFKDGFLLNDDFIGYADLVQTRHTNMIYAGNTVNEQRYCMQQDFNLNFTQANVEVLAEETALHNIKIFRNGGTQLIGSPWKVSAHFYGGTQQGPILSTETSFIAGTKTTAKDCWATVLKSDELGFCAAWIDRSYGSKLDHIGADDYMAFKNTTSWKFYNFVVRVDAESGRDYPVGTKFKWRGGYSYAPISIVNGIDSAFIFKKGLQDFIGYSALANTSGEIELPTEHIGTEAQGLESSLNGFNLDQTNYTATYSKLG